MKSYHLCIGALQRRRLLSRSQAQKASILVWQTLGCNTTRTFSDRSRRTVETTVAQFHSRQKRSMPQQQSPDTTAISEFSRDLSRLHQTFKRTSASSMPPLWEMQESPMMASQESRMELLNEISRLVNRLQDRIERKIIQPDRKYRREVSMIEERLLQHLVSCVYEGSSDVYPIVDQILTLMGRFQMDPFYTHCEAAMYIAAREGHWAEAAKVYQLYVDSETNYVVEDPTLGLFCIARHARDSGGLPVESVFEAVATLSGKLPNSSEKCTFFFIRMVELCVSWLMTA
jgi:hypothetical protein